ncbi:hypothetical protein JCM3774_000274 [Rhodotorula dairenensis]
MLRDRRPLKQFCRLPPQHGLRINVRRANRRKIDSVKRKIRPVDSHVKVHRAQEQVRTRGGVPRSWLDLEREEDREQVREFLRRTPKECRHWCGIDKGRVGPIAAKISIGTSVVDPFNQEERRAEATAIYTRGALLQQTRRVSAEASCLNTYMASQFDFTRRRVPPRPAYADSQGPAARREPSSWRASSAPIEPMPLRSSSPALASSSPSASNGTRPRSAPPEAAGLYDPLKDLVVVNGLHVLKKTNSIYSMRRVKSKVEREAEGRSVMSELVDLLEGGQRRRPRLGPLDRYVICVGKEGGSSQKKQKGPDISNTLLRMLPNELRRRGLSFVICLVPEHFTSQHCPRPRCTDSDGNRSQ